ncbi:MAG: hypothetical protein M0D53_12195 [Flavobacterium sp. JAD_PAG50586_2]|nr:MAG: hypothetical protein M0D53_12195 [Flavobacterium sp. JAD_PAG50586_2]
MTIPKKAKGLPVNKKTKKANGKPLSKTAVEKNKSGKKIKIEFEDEFLNNSIAIHNILE